MKKTRGLPHIPGSFGFLLQVVLNIFNLLLHIFFNLPWRSGRKKKSLSSLDRTKLEKDSCLPLISSLQHCVGIVEDIFRKCRGQSKLIKKKKKKKRKEILKRTDDYAPPMYGAFSFQLHALL
ncbi:hypothetical protein ACH5RR_014499 [Cinchona calisaya]|uniref:Uncharacterized protein n=1 Tax=Cinchona calisaya TaxID=153742 RepID=A0ABD3A6N5_9GENT